MICWWACFWVTFTVNEFIAQAAFDHFSIRSRSISSETYWTWKSFISLLIAWIAYCVMSMPTRWSPCAWCSRSAIRTNSTALIFFFRQWQQTNQWIKNVGFVYCDMGIFWTWMWAFGISRNCKSVLHQKCAFLEVFLTTTPSSSNLILKRRGRFQVSLRSQTDLNFSRKKSVISQFEFTPVWPQRAKCTTFSVHIEHWLSVVFVRNKSLVVRWMDQIGEWFHTLFPYKMF